MDQLPVLRLGVAPDATATPGGVAPVITGTMPSTKERSAVVLTKLLHTHLSWADKVAHLA
eukprot:11016836-Ditylum_brightwellii.AAC.1